MEEKSLSIRARKKVKAQLEKAERDRKVALFTKRMELARHGAMLYKQEKFKDAVSCYYKYMDILERFKGVKPGALDPKDFDQKKDVAEMLLLTGVFWDLAKLHDKSKKKDVKFQYFLDRYILFSKGMPYQHVSAELIRKLLINGNPNNRAAFKEAHVKLGGGKCFVVTAVSDYTQTHTLETLRDFRDRYLMERTWGRVFVRAYYMIGPVLASVVVRLPIAFRKRLASFFDRIAERCLF